MTSLERQRPIAMLVSRFRPGRLVVNPAFDAADEREIPGVARHEDESMIASGRSNQAIVQKTAAEPSRTQMSALNQSSHDERRPRPRQMGRGNDPPEILERSKPVLAVL